MKQVKSRHCASSACRHGIAHTVSSSSHYRSVTPVEENIHWIFSTERRTGPHSRFRVGAVLLTKSGHLITGANVENVAYPTGTCAERVALSTAVTSAQAKEFKAVAVATDKTDRDDGTLFGYCGPCGNCRQALREFCGVSAIPVESDNLRRHGLAQYSFTILAQEPNLALS